MRSSNTADLCSLVKVALQAILIRPFGRGGRGVQNIECRQGLGMFRPGAVAGFAGLSFPFAARFGFHGIVGVLAKSIDDIFMTRLACFSSNIG